MSLRRNLVLVLFTFCFSTILPAQTSSGDNIVRPVKSQRIKYAPGEIIVKYKTFTDPRGNEILREHENFLNVFKKAVNKDIRSSKPLYSLLTDEMVQKNMNELEAAREALLRRDQITGTNQTNSIGLLSSAALQMRQDFSKILVIRLKDNEEDAENIINEINSSRSAFTANGFEIEYAEPNYLYYTDTLPNDPLLSDQWSHYTSNARQAWDIEKGSRDIIISVIDSGVFTEHEDLTANILKGKGYDFVDADTAAYQKLGYKLINKEDYVTPDNDPSDCLGHGTHCAGIIGAEGNNGKGVTGVCQAISILPVRAGFAILENSGYETGFLEDAAIANGLRYAADNGARIISMSFGSDSPSQTMKDALDYASSRGVILVAAAGNNSSDQKSYPAGFDNVISVSATGGISRAGFSNYGSWVTIAAPGQSIISTYVKKDYLSADNPYIKLSGTSMAAPYIAGTAGLLLSHNPALTPAEVRWILKNSVKNPADYGVYFGSGLVDVLKALQTTKANICDAKAEITSPTEGQFFSQNVAIKGTAAGDSFKVFCGKGVYPAAWTLIASGTTVFSGQLASLPVSGLADGIYTIKLIVQNSAGTNDARVSVLIGNMAGMKTGWPQKLPIYNYDSFHCQEMAIDEKRKRIVVVAGKSSLSDDRLSESVYIYRSDGTLEKSWPLPYNGYTRIEPILEDLDNDGFNEILICAAGGYGSSLYRKGFIQIYRWNGDPFPGWPKQITSPGEVYGFCLADIDMDGQPEIIATTGTGNFYDADNPGALHALKKDGTYIKNFPVLLPKGYVPRSNLVAVNLDNDPAPEILFTAFYTPSPNSATHYTYAVKGDGSFAEGFPKATTSWGWTMAAGDINNDGINEIITQTQVLDNKGKPLPWARPQMNTYSSYVIADVNNDQKLETLYGDANANAYLVDSNGDALPGWPVRVNEFSADGDHIIADVDGDQKPEIILIWQANTVSSSGQRTGLYVYKTDGTLLEGFPRFSGAMDIISAKVSDIDSDGLAEIVGLDSQDQIFVLGMNKKYNILKSEWPQEMGDPWHTSCSIGSKVKFLSDLPELTTTQDSTLYAKIAPVYINWNNYKLADLKISPNDASVYFENGSMVFDPSILSRGIHNVSFTITNDYLSQTKNYTINVRHVNHAPFGVFKLLTPKDKAIIGVPEDSKDSLIISWEKTTDQDYRDSLIYKFYSDDSLKILNIKSTKSTSISIPYAYIRKVMDDNKLVSLKGTWTIYASDYIDSTISASGKLSLEFTTNLTGVEQAEIPTEYSLSQNYPNPFNPSTKIKFGLPKSSQVQINCFNIMGQHVSDIFSGYLKAGYHEVTFNAGSLPSGVYIYSLKTDEFSKTLKMLMVK